jgi:hypothetical protein
LSTGQYYTALQTRCWYHCAVYCCKCSFLVHSTDLEHGEELVYKLEVRKVVDAEHHLETIFCFLTLGFGAWKQRVWGEGAVWMRYAAVPNCILPRWFKSCWALRAVMGTTTQSVWRC